MEETRIEVSKKINSIKKVSRISFLVNRFIVNPLLAGVSGFTLFFLFAIFLDLAVNLFDSENILTIDIFTVLIGISGFALAFGFSFLESRQK